MQIETGSIRAAGNRADYVFVVADEVRVRVGMDLRWMALISDCRPHSVDENPFVGLRVEEVYPPSASAVAVPVAGAIVVVEGPVFQVGIGMAV